METMEGFDKDPAGVLIKPLKRTGHDLALESKNLCSKSLRLRLVSKQLAEKARKNVERSRAAHSVKKTVAKRASA